MKLFSITHTQDIATVTCFTHSCFSNSSFTAFQVMFQFVHKLLQCPCHHWLDTDPQLYNFNKSHIKQCAGWVIIKNKNKKKKHWHIRLYEMNNWSLALVPSYTKSAWSKKLKIYLYIITLTTRRVPWPSRKFLMRPPSLDRSTAGVIASYRQGLTNEMYMFTVISNI